MEGILGTFNSGYSIYKSLLDTDILGLIKDGDSNALEYLLQKYKHLVHLKAKTYFLLGAEKEDLIQEGMIGLCKAIRDYEPDHRTSFKVFAELCITRQIITAVKTYTRQKHIPLNSYISLNSPSYGDDDQERPLAETLRNEKIYDPVDFIINKEQFNHVQEYLVSELSSLEEKAFLLYIDGKTYQQIAARLERHVKSIDNALQRVKKKFENSLKQYNLEA